MSDEQPTEHLPTFEEKVLAELASINTRLSGLESQVFSLDQQIERRALETKPIWERALAEIMELRQETKDGFEKVENKIGVLNEDVLRLRAKIRITEMRR